MTGYLSLDLNTVVVDAALARRLPPGLAAYYLALPLSCEDGSISVAMAHPENESALAVLRTLLGAPIVPVRAPDAAIRRALARVKEIDPRPEPRVLVWSADGQALEAAARIATLFAGALAATVTTLAAPALDLQATLAIAREGAYNLAVLYAAAEVTPIQLWQQAETPLVVLGAPPAELRQILVVLRGYSADCHALEWLAHLLRRPGVVVTLLPLPSTAEAEMPFPLSLRRPQNSHLRACLCHATLQDAPVFVRFRQGPAAEQVATEVRYGAYDLVVIAAEGYGQFVSSVLSALEEEGSHEQLSFFILKPPAVRETEAPATTQQPA
jgi:hypothetical protein